MVIEVLQVLRLKEIGKKLHADIIEKVYHEELDRHRPCEKCPEGTATQ